VYGNVSLNGGLEFAQGVMASCARTSKGDHVQQGDYALEVFASAEAIAMASELASQDPTAYLGVHHRDTQHGDHFQV